MVSRRAKVGQESKLGLSLGRKRWRKRNDFNPQAITWREEYRCDRRDAGRRFRKWVLHYTLMKISCFLQNGRTDEVTTKPYNYIKLYVTSSFESLLHLGELLRKQLGKNWRGPGLVHVEDKWESRGAGVRHPAATALSMQIPAEPQSKNKGIQQRYIITVSGRFILYF